MAYTIDFTDSIKTPISVADLVADTSTNLKLIGQGYENFGEGVAENFLHLLENFASGSAPTKPVEGQIWYDSSINSLKYLDDTVANNGNWKPIASMTVQSGAPTSIGETDGHFWLDSDTGTFYIYFNGSWANAGNAGGDTNSTTKNRYDTNDVLHKTVEIIVNGEIASITSSDATSWAPQNSGVNAEYLEDGTTLLNTHFPTITQGINLNQGDNYFFSGTATSALYADLAERYHADAAYTYGTIVKIGGEYEITQTDSYADNNVFGIISDRPALMMNAGAGNSDTHPYVALAGRLPVKVIGTVSKGDRLISSDTAGYAVAAPTSDPNWQAVIGRALEDKINTEPGIIEAVVGAK